MARTVVIGLDGATFAVLDPLIEEGYLPNIASLRRRGAAGVLQSTVPPVTGPAWLALATGMTPGTSGVYDFIYRRDTERGFHFINSASFRDHAVWDLLSQRNKRVCLFNYPCLYPPYEVNGAMVSGGLGSPNVTHFTYPHELEGEMRQLLGDDRQLNLKQSCYRDRDLFIQDLTASLERKIAGIDHLMQQEKWDFVWMVISETDWLSHMMWDCFDETCDPSREDAKRLTEAFKGFWSRVDEAVGRIVELAGTDCDIMIVSDHGFGPVSGSFALNVWLKEHGYLVERRGGWSGYEVTKRIRKAARSVAKLTCVDRFFPKFFAWGKDRTVSIMIPLHFIDFSRTQAYDPGHIGSFGGIYLNRSVLKEPEQVERVRNELLQRLRDYGEENGIAFDLDIPEKVYGSRTPESPDILLRVNGGGGVVLKEFDGRRVHDGELPDRIGFLRGTHRREGVLIAAGPSIAQTQVSGARVWDVAPTLLHCHGVPLPDTMEGSVIRQLLRENGENVTRTAGAKDASRTVSLTPDEEAIVRRQLSDLGYL